MRLSFALPLVLLLGAAPAAAQSTLSLGDIARQFCLARVAGDMNPLASLLTPDLAAAAASRLEALAPGAAPASCMPVGASGTYDHPESILAYRAADGATSSDRLVLSFIDGQLRIDDIAFADGSSLRQGLGLPPVR